MGDANPFSSLPPIGAAPSAPPPPAAIKPGADPFADLPPIGAQSQAPDATVGSIASNFAAPVNTAIAKVAGAPMDFGVAANDAAITAGQWLKQEIGLGPADYSKRAYVPDWIPTSKNIEGWMGKAGVTTSKDIQPQNLPEKMSAAAGNSVAALGETYAGGKALLQSGLEQASPLLGKVVRTITDSMESPAGSGALTSALQYAKTALTNAGIWGTAGATGKLAETVAPDQYKPLADFFGQILGGGVAAGAAGAVDAAAGVGKNILGKFTQPLTSSGQEQMAGNALRSAATDQGMTAANLEDVKPLVPGSAPTAGQGTNDPGLMQLERGLAQKNPAEYSQRLSDQNAARVGAIQGMAPDTAQPAAVSDFFKNAYDAIDQQTNQAVDQAQRHLNIVAAQQTASTQAAQSGAQNALADIGGQGTAEQYGQAIRNTLAEQQGQAKAKASALWNAVDPTGSATVNVTPLKQASFDVRSQMPKVAKPMDGEEKAIFDAADGLPEVASFKDLQALDSRIGSEIRTLRGTPGNDPALRRLQILKDSVRDTMAGAAGKVAADDAAAVQAGTKAPADTIFARLQRDFAEAFGGQQAKTATREVGAGPESGIPAGGQDTLPAGNGASEPGNQVPGGGMAAGPSGAAGVPTADQDLAQRYTAAKAATLQQKQTFNQAPGVGDVLKPGSQGRPFATLDSGVGDKVFVAGPKGGQTIQAYQKAGGDPARLQDYIAYSLRQAAVRDGTLDPAAYANWAKRYGPALQALPPEMTAPFFRAAAAQQGAHTASEDAMAAVKSAQAFLDDQASARVQALKAAQNDSARHFLKDQDPDRAVAQTIGRPDDFKAVVRSVAADPDAKAGLQRATVDFLLKRFQGTQLGVGTSEGILRGGQLGQWLKTNRSTLAPLFTPRQLDMIDSVVADIQRQNLVTSSSKLPMGSNTAQDLANQASSSRDMTVLDHIIHEAGGAGIGAIAAGPVGAVGGGVLGRIASSLRAAGLKRVDDLLMQAVMDPQFGAMLLKKVGPKGPDPLTLKILNGRLAALMASAYATKDSQ